ncbi:hypothetical protein CJF32_00008185 [Rutstroemia sp. NJR-2017a WRK4]|nr:hypothetical protein CJF32_00008185 [Rutstroemia sp. NJR-2017a WRK4]
MKVFESQVSIRDPRARALNHNTPQDDRSTMKSDSLDSPKQSDNMAAPRTDGSNSLLATDDLKQLPTPSPTPSPRSSSPSLMAMDNPTQVSKGRKSVPESGKERSETSRESIPSEIVSEDVVFGDLAPPPPLSKLLPQHELHNIPEEKGRTSRKASMNGTRGDEKILKLSPAEIKELTSAPESLPLISPNRLPIPSPREVSLEGGHTARGSSSEVSWMDLHPNDHSTDSPGVRKTSTPETSRFPPESNSERRQHLDTTLANTGSKRPTILSARAFSAQPPPSQWSSYSKSGQSQTSPKRKPAIMGSRPEPLSLEGLSIPKSGNSVNKPSHIPDLPPSPIPQSIPLPPMSIPTYLQLELSATRPSPLYIYRSASSEFPYESSKVKFERLLNFLLLPPQLEQVLYFGSLACLDAWLYTFTILPLRFFKALGILISWWGHVLAKEFRFITGFIYHGTSRMWQRRNDRRSNESTSPSRSVSRSSRPPISATTSFQSQHGRQANLIQRTGSSYETPRVDGERRSRQGWARRHRRVKSQPSSLSSYNKADLLQGAVIIFSSFFLMMLDASRMYHSIRAQSAIRLYVIYNLLEVFDRLAAALGQDIFECLFSDETLERDSDGRSKVLRPLGMFLLALMYNVAHSAALFAQVVTLNVAVNSYSNALVTLLLSNQFVEVKGTVFKKFEKDNLFQLTCADVVERFQLWLMLMIIAMRNVVEMGGFSSMVSSASEAASSAAKNSTIPLRTNSILPNAFTLLPGWSGEVLSPFLIVIGSEMLVDWIKHAYISKFNGVKPAIYQRFLDVLAKDYYTNAFVNQNLVKRLGLPVIPLSCLFIRAAFQTYHMFLATHLPPPLPSTATSLSVESSPATTAALEHFDTIIRKALGRSTFGLPNPNSTTPWFLPSADDVIASITMIVFFLGAFFVLLAFKLVLGMVLLKFARDRYSTMKKREHRSYDTGGKRVGGWGMVEVDDDKKRWIYDDDPETLKKLREKERAARDKEKVGAVQDFSKISRYEMAAKRIW